MSFYYDNGFLWCERLRVKDIQKQVEQSPFYLYSTEQLKKNFLAYNQAFRSGTSIISYAVKANGNLALLKQLRKLGCWATLVSGNEIQLALSAGFNPNHLIFNGNGKTLRELRYAIQHGTLVNIDSEFDLHHVLRASQDVQKSTEILIRITPDIDPGVHPYISTGLKESKFGIPLPQIPDLLFQLSQMPSLTCVGIHCHIGSTIESIEIFKRLMGIMAKQFRVIKKQGFPLKFINIGGGLSIDYHRDGTAFPTPNDLAIAIQNILPHNATLILEPGRSLIGNAGILICKVIGVKSSGDRRFIVTDGSMSEFIRPSLYQAYHKIDFIQPVFGEARVFDIVGPVCESGDFLGKNRELPTPPEGSGLAVFDSGAYGYAMSSNYNGRLKPPEYLVNKNQLTQIRRAELVEDLFRLFK